VLLTRSFAIASIFVQNEGVGLLLDTKFIGSFPAHHPLVMLILRHCVESADVLMYTMDKEIGIYIANSRNRPGELSSFLKGNAHLCLRDPSVFVAATAKKFNLTKFDISKKSYIITPVDETKTIDSSIEIIPKPLFEQFSENNLSPVFGKCVNQLVNQILSFKLAIKSGTITPVEKIQIQTNRCFILQCLSELSISYSVVKFDIMHSSQRRSSKSNLTPKKDTVFLKNSFIAHILHDLIPRALKSSDAPVLDSDLQQAESAWAACLICSLCVGKESPKKDTNAEIDLQNIRKIVIENVGKCLKDTALSSNHSETRYGKLVSLSELCYRILSPRTLSGPSIKRVETPHETVSLHLARIMIDKGFVSTFTSIIADLDVHHPASKEVIESILKPLEILSKAAVTLGKLDVSSALSSTSLQTPKTKKAANLTFNNALEELVHDDDPPPSNNEISDMYRNSALGVLDPADEDEFDYSDNDEEGEEFSEDSQESDDMDEGSDEDDEMEIVVLLV
jgi:E3 ubiquitin-protein ligase HUWE1